MTNIILTDFPGSSVSEKFTAAIEFMQKNPGTTLVIPKGEYILTSELARKQMDDVLRGNFGRNPQDVMLSPLYTYTRGVNFENLTDCKIEGDNAVFIVDGFMQPFTISHCKNIELSGITIDHKRKPYSTAVISDIGEVAANGEVECTFTFEEDIYPETPLMLRNIFYDEIRDCLPDVRVATYSYIDARHIQAKLTGGEHAYAGMKVHMSNTYHSRPAIFIDHSADITVCDVTIHSQPGMGILGNRSGNITIRRLSVVPTCGHHVSTNTDATHFTSVKGKLSLEDCRFEGNGDDFINVHGFYHRIVEKEDFATYLVKDIAADGPQSTLIEYPDPGDVMELTLSKTLQVVGTYNVVSAEPLAAETRLCRITLDRPLPDDIDEYLIANISQVPILNVTGCTAVLHNARGLLVRCREALLKNNTFRGLLGPAIYVSAEVTWGESVTPANVRISNNRIVNCAELFGEAAGIIVEAVCANPQGHPIHDIVIENNSIDSPKSDHGIIVRNTDGLILRNNKCNTKNDPVIIEDCINVICE